MEQLGVSEAAAGYEADEETEAAQVQRALSASLSAAVAALRHNMPSTTGLVLSPRAGPRDLALLTLLLYEALSYVSYRRDWLQ